MAAIERTGTEGRGPGSASEALVLIVDDNEDAGQMIDEYLRFSGFRTAIARNGFEAIQMAIALKPAAILMDLALPGLDGYEATRRLKADVRTRCIPIIALTANTLPRHEALARQAGCERFLAKPIMPDQVRKELRLVLESHH